MFNQMLNEALRLRSVGWRDNHKAFIAFVNNVADEWHRGRIGAWTHAALTQISLDMNVPLDRGAGTKGIL